MNTHIENHCSDCPSQCHSIFQGIPDALSLKLASARTIHHYRKGEIIFHQDTPCFGIHCIGTGMVKTFTCEEDGKIVIHRLATQGDLLGHHSMFRRKNYYESAMALEDTTCCFVEKSFVLELLHTCPSILAESLQKVSQELHYAYSRNIELTNKSVRERLAGYLMAISRQQDQMTVRLSREEIASFIGTTSETVIRCISEFKELGYITEENRSFQILDHEKLAGLAQLNNWRH